MTAGFVPCCDCKGAALTEASVPSSPDYRLGLLAPGSASATAWRPWPPTRTPHYTQTANNNEPYSSTSLNGVLRRQKSVSATVLQDFSLNEICWNQTNKSLATEATCQKGKCITKSELPLKRHSGKKKWNYINDFLLICWSLPMVSSNTLGKSIVV